MEKKPTTNMVILEGEITNLFDKRNEKAPRNMVMKVVEEYNGNTRTNYIMVSTYKDDGLRVGDVIRGIGGIRTSSWENSEGKKQSRTEIYLNSIEVKDYHAQATQAPAKNDGVDEVVPDDIPDEINMDDIPF